MTIQTVVQSAALRIAGTVPAAVFSSTDQVVVEMRDLVQDVAMEIVKAAEWRDLTKIGTLTGASSFPLPANFDRMLTGQGMQDQGGWFWGYQPFGDVSEYLMAVNGQIPTLTPGGWIIFDEAFNFHPAPSGTATYPYISKFYAKSDVGVLMAAFDSDTDTFILSERLLTLGLIWRYRAQKGLDYSEDMATYSTALDQLSNSDKGARILRLDSVSRLPGARMAYSGRVHP